MTTPTANPSAILFNFYRRYKWTDIDFGNFQTGVMNSFQGVFDATFHGAALQGLGYVSATGLNFTIDGGVACGPTGNLLVLAASATGAFAAPTGGLPCRSLVVIRPNIIQTSLITSPTSPMSTVPLQQLQQAQIIVINGVPNGSPSYPSTSPNDVVCFGVRLAAGASSFASSDLDFEIRDLIGKNSLIQHHTQKYDDRCRPFASSSQLLGIKPSQTVYPDKGPKQFTFINKDIPSLFPRASGVFAGTDTFLNFQSGAITGGDTTSPSFSPSIPSAGQSIVAVVALSTSDILSVTYGTAGTYAQCQNGIFNQVGTGAGSVPSVSNAMILAWVILTSNDGSNITALDVYDGRSMFQYAGAASNTYPTNFVTSEADLSAATTSCSSNGGGVICLTNSFSISSQHTIPKDTKLIGRRGSTVITFLSGSLITLADGAIMEDVYLLTTQTSLTMVQLSNFYTIVRGCNFNLSGATTSIGINVIGSANRMYNNVFSGVAGELNSGIKYSNGADNLDDSSVLLP